MANVRKDLRVQDTDIKRLNHLGLGLKAIAEHLGCHSATITLRLKAMGISPTDTRRSFMEGVFESLTRDQQDWLSHNLFNAGIGVKEFVATLIREAYEAQGGSGGTPVPVAPAPMPELEGGSSGSQQADIDEQPVGGRAYGPEDKPSPEDTVEPEKLENKPEEKPKPSSKKKLNFKKK